MSKQVAMSDIGAESAFRGFRSQTLYIVKRIMAGCGQDIVFQPEGQEDLAVYDENGTLFEVVQVKNLNCNLTLSDLNPQREDSFLRRSLRLFASGKYPKLSLVSFGVAGPELVNAINMPNSDHKRNIISKLQSYGYKDAEIEILFQHLCIEEIIEEDCIKVVMDYLMESHVGADPYVAFDLLMHWVSVLSENKGKVTQNDFIQKLDNICRYLSERLAFHREHYTTICPVRLSDSISNMEYLEEEFYIGVPARYEHIVAGLDVIRKEKLSEVKLKFESFNIVIIHGASGQGKSTLAYRFLHEYCPETLTYQIKHVSDRQHALTIIRALHGIAKATKQTLWLYLDVSPGNSAWTELIAETTQYSSFKVLLTVREEDWNKASIIGANLLYSTTELKFDRIEAEEIYQRLSQYKSCGFLNFEEVWLKFGGNGPLLEFTYLLSQGQTLRERLKGQINSIINEAECLHDLGRVDLLRIVSLAGSYGAKINARKLVQILNLNDALRTIKVFEREYLLKTSADGSYIEGLHPIRSQILVDILYDSTICPISNMVSQCLYVINEHDFEVYLLHYFYSNEPEEAIKFLENHNIQSWTGLLGVLRSLLWLGINKYVSTHRALINEIYQNYGSSWFLIFLGNISDTMEDDFFNVIKSLDYIDQTKIDDTEKYKEVLKDKSIVYKDVSDWLEKASLPTRFPDNDEELSCFGQCLFWCGYLKIDKMFQFNDFDIARMCESFSIEAIADVVVGLFSIHRTDIIDKYRPVVIKRIQSEENIPLIENDGAKITFHHIIDLIDIQDGANFAYKQTMSKINLFRRIYPDRKTIACQGYGHKIIENLPDYDDTFKEIPIERLPLIWLIRLNTLFIGLVDWPYRPNTWESYVQLSISNRKNILVLFSQMLNSVEKYIESKSSNFMKGIDFEKFEFLTKNLRDRIYLPQVSVDKWGLTNENSGEPITKNLISEVYLNIQGLSKFVQQSREINADIRNFLEHAQKVLFAHVLCLGKSAKEASQIKANVFGGTDLGRLSTYNLFEAVKLLPAYQEQFNLHFNKFMSVDELRKMEIKERDIYETLAAAWGKFSMEAYRPQKKLKQVLQKNLRAIKSSIPKSIQDSFRLNNINMTLRNVGDNRYLLIDVDDPIEIFNVLEKSFSIIGNAIRPARFPSLKYMVLETIFPNFVLVFTVKKRLVFNQSYSFSLYRLINEETSEIGTIDVMPHPLPEYVQLDMEIWPEIIPEIKDGQNLMINVSELYYSVVHLLKIKELGEKLPDDNLIGIDVFKAHFLKFAGVLQQKLQLSINDLGALLSHLSRFFEQEKPEANDFSELFQILNLIKNDLISVESSDNEIIYMELSLEKLDEWSLKLRQARDNSVMFCYCWSSVIIKCES